jgi:hypothetical protein
MSVRYVARANDLAFAILSSESQKIRVLNPIPAASVSAGTIWVRTPLFAHFTFQRADFSRFRYSCGNSSGRSRPENRRASNSSRLQEVSQGVGTTRLHPSLPPAPPARCRSGQVRRGEPHNVVQANPKSTRRVLFPPHPAPCPRTSGLKRSRDGKPNPPLRPTQPF